MTTIEDASVVQRYSDVIAQTLADATGEQDAPGAGVDNASMITSGRPVMSDRRPYDPTLVPNRFGFNNTGVICWCNSILQALLSCSALTQTVLERKAFYSENNNVFALAYVGLLEQIFRDGPDASGLAGMSAALLGAFKHQIATRGYNFRIGNSQECADEAFTLFIDMFGDPEVEKLFINVYQSSVKCTLCGEETVMVRDKNFRVQMFGRYDINTYVDFRSYLCRHPDRVEDYKCEKCGGTNKVCIRTEKLRHLSDVLVIIFDKYGQKDNRWFPQALAFKATDGEQLRYDLVAQVEHSGTTSGGHYWSVVRRRTGVFNVNDQYVKPQSFGPTETTFMLVYHLVRPQSQGRPA